MHRHCRGMIVFAHTKIASTMIGGIMVLWSALAFGPADSLFAAYLARGGHESTWGVVMLLNGSLLLFGGMFKWRVGRHIGLTLACFILLALGGYFFQEGLFTPVTVTMPFLALMSLITLMAEVGEKPRGRI